MEHPPSPTTILFVRHAQTVWNLDQRHTGSSEVALSPQADRQIATLTRSLLPESIEAIYTSPLSRCQLTIKPLSEIIGKQAVIRPDLQERHLGTWEGQSPKELLPLHPGYHFPESAYNGDFHIPGAEPLEDLEQRIRLFVQEMQTRHPGKTIVVSTHSGVIWTLQHRIVNNPPETWLWPSNCSVTRIRYDGRHFILELITTPD
jgi:broad specificity phosphatase PhoE